MTDSYLKVAFPYETKLVSGSHVRLIGVIGNTVIGATYSKGYDEAQTEHVSQPLHWDENGMWASGEYPQMNLVPLPNKLNAEIERLQGLRNEAWERLDSFPDAPLIWREGDERTVKSLDRQIEALVEQLPSQEEADVAETD